MDEKIRFGWFEFKKKLIGLYKGPIWIKASPSWLGHKTKNGLREDRELEDEYYESIQSLIKNCIESANDEIESTVYRLRIEELFKHLGLPYYNRYFYYPEDFNKLSIKLEEVETEINEDQAKEELRKIKNSQKKEEPVQKLETKKSQQRTRDEKFASSFDAGSVPVERAISFFLLEKARRAEEIVISQGRLDYQVCWILDAIAHKFIEEQLSSEQKKGVMEDPRVLISSKEELINVADSSIELRESNNEEFKDKGIIFSINDSEIKKVLDKTNLSNKRIAGLVDRLCKIVLTGKHFQFWDNEKGEFVDIEKEISMPFLTVETEIIHRKLRGRGAQKNEEHLYNFQFWSYWGLAFLSNLYSRKLDLFPKRFYKLSGKAQELFRAVCWSEKPTTFNIETISRLLGWKKVSETKQIQTRRSAIKQYLNERTGVLQDTENVLDIKS